VTATLRRGALAVLTMVDGLALCRLAPSPGELLRGITAPHAWVNRVGTDAAAGTVAGALLWLTALWLMLGLLITLAASRAGRPDGLLEALARRVTPSLIRRLVTTATGASLFLGPAVASATPTAPSSAAGMPVSAAAAGGASATRSLPAATTPGPPLDPAPAAGTVLVKPGDSLWRLTAQRLGPSASDRQIAVDWPYWYSANRQVIGRNPNLLRPGERLTVPTVQEGPADG
jgi:nucleoid-associated protein YgaU